jgi:type VI secretion system secreted protein Hcp
MAVDSFLELGDIKGESRDSEFSGLIDVLAWSWGASQSGPAVAAAKPT